MELKELRKELQYGIKTLYDDILPLNAIENIESTHGVRALFKLPCRNCEHVDLCRKYNILPVHLNTYIAKKDLKGL